MLDAVVEPVGDGVPDGRCLLLLVAGLGLLGLGIQALLCARRANAEREVLEGLVRLLAVLAAQGDTARDAAELGHERGVIHGGDGVGRMRVHG